MSPTSYQTAPPRDVMKVMDVVFSSKRTLPLLALTTMCMRRVYSMIFHRCFARCSTPRRYLVNGCCILTTSFQELILRRTYMVIGDPYGIRTRVTAVKGRCLNRLTNGPYKLVIMAESEGFEPSRRFNTAYTISNRAPSATRTALHWLHR